MPQKTIWTWSQPHRLTYQGNSSLGVLLLIWTSEPPPFPKSGWTVSVFSRRGHPWDPATHTLWIPATTGWDEALEQATTWAEALLPPAADTQSAPQQNPLDWAQGAAVKAGEWVKQTVNRIRRS